MKQPEINQNVAKANMVGLSHMNFIGIWSLKKEEEECQQLFLRFYIYAKCVRKVLTVTAGIDHVAEAVLGQAGSLPVWVSGVKMSKVCNMSSTVATMGISQNS